MHIQFDGGWDGDGEVVVAGLAGEDGVQVRALQVRDDQLVDDFVTQLVKAVIQEGVISPPGHLERNRWISNKEYANLLKNNFYALKEVQVRRLYSHVVRYESREKADEIVM